MPSPDNAWAVILAGGQGTRLWPLSRNSRPKQYLDLQGDGSTLLQKAAGRASRLVGSLERVLVVTAASQADLAREQLPALPPDNLLLEPQGRNTAASIGLAAVHLQRRDEQAVMAVLPADHLYRDERPWLAALQSGLAYAAASGALVTFGIQPHSPSTQYGYLLRGPLLNQEHPNPVYTGERFLEKPGAEKAQQLFDDGRYLWNTGNFAWRAAAILEAIERCLPELYAGLQHIRRQPVLLSRLYPELPEISIDYGVLEKAGPFAIVAAEFERIDLGALTALAEILPADADHNAFAGELIAQQAGNNLVYNPDRLTALVGVHDLVIIAAGDVLLIGQRDQVGRVREIVARLRQAGQEQYL